MSDTLFLIDGHSLLYQSFYALPGLTSPDGAPTGAVFGFLRFVEKILRERAPGALAVVLDAPGRNFRHEAYPAYKATRKPMPDELRPQIPLLLEILEARGIRTLRREGVEADDVLGTLARRAAAQGRDVCIVSRDKDLKQLLGDGVTILDPRTESVLDADGYRAETGLDPGRFPDLVGLAGDSSDNIPGVPGVGEKTALDLLRSFGSLEGVLTNWDRVKGPKRQQALKEHAALARLSRDLAVIRTDLALDLSLDDLAPGPSDPDRLNELYRSLGFGSLVQAVPEGPETRDYRAVDRAGLKRLAARLRKAEAFAFDTETTGPDAVGCALVGLSFSMKPGEAFYVPVRAPAGALDEAEVLATLAPILSDPTKGKIGHNLKFDATVLLRRGVRLEGMVFDTLVAAYLLNPGRRSLKLDTLSEELLQLKKIPITDLIGEGKEQTTLDRVDLARVAEYACEDADAALRLKEVLAPRIEAEGLTEVFARAEMPLVGILTAMETAGIGLDTARLLALDVEVGDRMEALEGRIVKAAGETFNLNSTKQLREILYEKMGLPTIRKTEKKTGASTDAETLTELARICRRDGLAAQGAMLQNLLEYRVLKKLQSTYIRSLPRAIHPATGRLHASFNQAVAATGRLSSSEPNLQNIPTRTELGSRIREAFVPAPGHRFVTADYSQVELRIMAHLSRDPELMRAFEAGEDIHAAVAARIHGVATSEVTKPMRTTAKAVNFGILYGQTAFGLAREIEVSQGEAQGFIDAYFERFAGVKVFIEALLERAREEGRVRTLLGRIRPIPEIKAANRTRRMLGERTAVNTVIQGTAADLIKLAMVAVDARIRRAGWPARMLLQIHDELLFEVEADAVEAVRRGVVEEMEGAMDLTVPLKVDAAVGDNWMEL